jgi:predicted DNA-binding transcriptional regulator YafY
MARADRLFRLLQALRRLPAPVTARRLAEETDVSLRTLYRDIAALRATGALIDGEAGLGYTLTEDPALPPQMFTRLEVEALVLGLAEVGQMGDPALARAAAEALGKVVATLPERVARQALHATAMVYRYQPRPPAPACLAVLREAAWAEQAVDISYADMEGRPTRRQIWPLAIVFLDRTLMCLAWCCLRQDFRRFRLDRIVAAAPADDWFRPRRVALLRDYMARLRSRTANVT